MRLKLRISVIVYATLWALSLLVIANNNSLDSGSLFFMICTGGFSIYLIKNNKRDTISVGYKIVLWLITIYFSFALFGRSIFMRQARVEFTISKIIYFIIFVVVLYPLSLGMLVVFEKLSQNVCRYNVVAKNNIIRVGLSCGVIVFVVDLILTLSYYPCTMTNDSRGHWLQAIGEMRLTDYSPIAFNLLLKGLFAITRYTTPYIFVLFQTFVLSFVVGDVTAFLYRRGVGTIKLMIGSLLFALLPSTYILLLYLSKNPLTGVLCMGTVVVLLQMIVEPEYYLMRPLWYIKSIIMISGFFLVRQNNVVIILPLIGFFTWFFLVYRKLRKQILILLVGVACILFLMIGIVYKTIDYEHVVKYHETIRPLLAPIGSAIKQEIPLPDTLLNTAGKVLSIEEWEKRYDPSNSDIVTYGEPRPQYDKVSLKEGMSAYFMMIKLYPDIVIKDRLDGMNCIWDIRASVFRCPNQLEGEVSFKDAKLPDGLIGYAAGKVRLFSSSLFDISANEQVLDIFIWKNGIYIYLLMLATVFLYRSKKGKLLWAILPSVFILIIYVLVLGWQMYFYLWFFPLSVVTLMLVSIVECGKKGEIIEVEDKVNI